MRAVTGLCIAVLLLAASNSPAAEGVLDIEFEDIPSQMGSFFISRDVADQWGAVVIYDSAGLAEFLDEYPRPYIPLRDGFFADRILIIGFVDTSFAEGVGYWADSLVRVEPAYARSPIDDVYYIGVQPLLVTHERSAEDLPEGRKLTACCGLAVSREHEVVNVKVRVPSPGDCKVYGIQTSESPPPPARPRYFTAFDDSPEIMTSVPPVYPDDAKAAGIEGVVLLKVGVTELGDVAEATVVRGIEGLDDAAIAAVLLWKFKPAKRRGEPVPVRIVVPVRFELED